MTANGKAIVALIIDWSDGGDNLLRHLQNGVCRGLYSQELADEAGLRLRIMEEEIVTSFVDIAKEA